jgi:hypothetical protein
VPYPTYVGTSSVKSVGFGTDCAFVSTGLALSTGDFLVGVLGGGGASITWPVGWTVISQTANSRQAVSIAYHRYTSGDSMPDVTWTGGTSAYGFILQFTGVVATGTPYGAVQEYDNGTSGAPSPTTLMGGGMVTEGTQSLVLDVEVGGGTLATPSGYTAAGGSVGDGLLFATEEETGGGTTTAISYSLGGTSAYYIDTQIELLSEAVSITGTWASTDAKDVMDFLEAPRGTWASTDVKDVMDMHGGPLGEMQLDGFTSGGAQSAGSGVSSASVTLSTNLDDDVIVVCVANGGFWQYAPIASVSDTAGLTWHRRASHPAPQGQQEIWWAHAPTPLSADVITVHISADPALAGGDSPMTGETGEISIVAFAVNGANYSAPWDTHILAHGWSNNNPYGEPLTGLISTAASNTFCFGFYDNNSNLVSAPSSPFTYMTDAQYTEHNGFTTTAAVAYNNVTALQDGAKVGFGSGGSMMTDAVVQAGLPGTTNEILWYFDGGSFNVLGDPIWPGNGLAFTGNDSPVFSMSMTTNYGNEMIVLACLIASAGGAGTVAGISDTVGLSPGWARRSRTVSSDGTLALEIWWAWTHRALNNSDGITITPANVVNGDSMTVLGFAIVGATGFYDNVWWDGGELPLSATGLSTESAVTSFSTLSLDTLNFAIMGNTDGGSVFTLPPGSNAVAPYAVGPQIATAGPISNLAMIYNYSGPVTITNEAIEDTVIPPLWVAVGDAIPVGPPLPPTGAWASTEATDKTTNDGAFEALGWNTGWVGYAPAHCTWASTDAKDTATNDGAFDALGWVTGWAGFVPAHCTWASTDAKDHASGNGWLIPPQQTTGQWASQELRDRWASSNIAAVTAVWQSTEPPSRWASAGFPIPTQKPVPAPRKRRLMIIT